MIKALVFDFDGLIIDSESPELQAWQEAFAARGRTLSLDLWADVVGRPPAHFDFCAYFRDHIDPAIDIEDFRQRRRQRVIALTLEQPVLPGVFDYLQSASGMGLKIGVASSSSRAHVAGHLERLGLLPFFSAILCFEDTAEHKPNPAPYLAALDQLDVRAHEAIAFEDSPHGVRAAKAAGIFCVAIPNPVTCLLPLDHADHRMTSMAEEPLLRILERATRFRI